MSKAIFTNYVMSKFRRSLLDSRRASLPRTHELLDVRIVYTVLSNILSTDHRHGRQYFYDPKKYTILHTVIICNPRIFQYI